MGVEKTRARTRDRDDNNARFSAELMRDLTKRYEKTQWQV
jgi:hypothetical protein